jgi:hypothetical protein
LQTSPARPSVRTMTISFPPLLIAAGLTLALLIPSAASAQTPPDLPVGEARGVRLVEDRGGLVLIFSARSAKLRERISSRYAWISCTNLGEMFGGAGNLDVPRHGRRVPTGFSIDDPDFCRFFLRSHTIKRDGSRRRAPRRVLFSIPLTQAGAVYLDEEAKTAKMLLISAIASLVKNELKLSGHPTYAQLVQEHPKLAKLLVALSAPGETPLPTRIGYYSDGQEHIALAILSASGKRLFIENSAGDVLSTNVAAHLFGDRD